MTFVTFKSDLVKLVIFHFGLVATPRSNRTKNNSTKRKLLFKACLGCCSSQRVLIKDKQLMDERRVKVTI